MTLNDVPTARGQVPHRAQTPSPASSGYLTAPSTPNRRQENEPVVVKNVASPQHRPQAATPAPDSSPKLPPTPTSDVEDSRKHTAAVSHQPLTSPEQSTRPTSYAGITRTRRIDYTDVESEYAVPHPTTLCSPYFSPSPPLRLRVRPSEPRHQARMVRRHARTQNRRLWYLVRATLQEQ